MSCVDDSWSNRRLSAAPLRQLGSQTMPSRVVGNLKTTVMS